MTPKPIILDFGSTDLLNLIQGNSRNIFEHILWATLSAAGPRPLLIALGLQILGIVARGSLHFWYPLLSFGLLGGSTLASCGTLGRSLDTGEQNKGHFEVQAGFLSIFDGFDISF